MLRVPSPVEGLTIERDLRAGTWRVHHGPASAIVRQWTWGERRRLLQAAAASGALDAALFTAGLFDLVIDGALAQTDPRALALVCLHLLETPEDADVPPLAHLEMVLATRFGWTPRHIDEQPATDIDRLLAQIAPAPGNAVAVPDEGWTRIVVLPDASPIDAMSSIERRLTAMLLTIARWAGVAETMVESTKSDATANERRLVEERASAQRATASPANIRHANVANVAVQNANVENANVANVNVPNMNEPNGNEPNVSDPNVNDPSDSNVAHNAASPYGSSISPAPNDPNDPNGKPFARRVRLRAARASELEKARNPQSAMPEPRIARVASRLIAQSGATATHERMPALPSESSDGPRAQHPYRSEQTASHPVRPAERAAAGPVSHVVVAAGPASHVVIRAAPLPAHEPARMARAATLASPPATTPSRQQAPAAAIDRGAARNQDTFDETAFFPTFRARLRWPGETPADAADVGTTVPARVPDDPFASSDLEERIADVLDRASREAGIDLP